MAILTPVGSKLEATFLNAGREEVAHVSGDFWGGSANIALKDGTALAHISRHVLNASEAGADVQTVCVEGGEMVLAHLA